MAGHYLFLISVVLIATTAIFYAYRNHGGPLKYIKTEEGKKVAFGWVAFIGIGALLVLFSPKSEAVELNYFKYGEIYLGLDYTKKLSPQCEANPYDDRGTSNGGIRINLIQSVDKRGELNFKYTHHSCSFGPDREQYDSAGLEASYKFFMR